MDTDYTFQIEKSSKNKSELYNCTLIDKEPKYGWFIVKYNPNDGSPGVGDIIHVSKILCGTLPSNNANIYFCKSIQLIKRAQPFQVDIHNLTNFS